MPSTVYTPDTLTAFLRSNGPTGLAQLAGQLNHAHDITSIGQTSQTSANAANDAVRELEKQQRSMASMKENVDGLRSQIGELVERVGSGGVGRGPANADDDDDEDQQSGATSGSRRNKKVELSNAIHLRERQLEREGIEWRFNEPFGSQHNKELALDKIESFMRSNKPVFGDVPENQWRDLKKMIRQRFGNRRTLKNRSAEKKKLKRRERGREGAGFADSKYDKLFGGDCMSSDDELGESFRPNVPAWRSEEANRILAACDRQAQVLRPRDNNGAILGAQPKARVPANIKPNVEPALDVDKWMVSDDWLMSHPSWEPNEDAFGWSEWEG